MNSPPSGYFVRSAEFLLLAVMSLVASNARGESRHQGPDALSSPAQVVRGGQSAADKRENALLTLLRARLQKTNPKVELIRIMELRGFPVPEARKYVVIVWGVRKDLNFSGEFADELFGFFVVDQTLSRIDDTLNIVPTPRWLDYSFHITAISDEEIVITGQGVTYGDQPYTYKFPWKPYS